MSEQDLLNVTIGDEETQARPVEFDEAGLAIMFHTTCPKCSQLIEIPRVHKFSCQSCGVLGSTPFVPVVVPIPKRLMTDVPETTSTATNISVVDGAVVIRMPDKNVIEQVVQQGPIIDPIVAGTFSKALIDYSVRPLLQPGYNLPT
jgi:hypothetical protein